MRGNLIQAGREMGLTRSIPACAGEPPLDSIYRVGYTVYPRVCGGTIGNLPPGRAEDGLSPRVRGNLPPSNVIDFMERSIPACAGEPHQDRQPVQVT